MITIELEEKYLNIRWYRTIKFKNGERRKACAPENADHVQIENLVNFSSESFRFELSSDPKQREIDLKNFEICCEAVRQSWARGVRHGYDLHAAAAQSASGKATIKIGGKEI